MTRPRSERTSFSGGTATRLLVYGANGFTGRLIVDEARSFGMRPILGGRSRAALESMARASGLAFRSGSLDDPAAVVRLVEGVDVVLNAAGPFAATALPLVRACLERGVHYLDVNGEIPTLEAVAALGDAARAHGIMLMPAVGFDVVPSDCMASWVVARLPSASELSIGISGLDAITRGSAESVLQVSDGSIPVRRGGKLVQVPPGAVEHDFDFGHGTTRGTAIPWADVVTAYHSTRVPNITAYYEATPLVRLAMAMIGTSGSLLKLPPWKSWFQAGVRSLPDGPDEKYRQRQRAVIVVTARDPAGRTVSARVETPEVYSFTATTAVSIADRVLHGDFRTGFQTPACVYGPDLLFALPGVTRTLLA